VRFEPSQPSFMKTSSAPARPPSIVGPMLLPANARLCNCS
jgi:hypothetical protein